MKRYAVGLVDPDSELAVQLERAFALTDIDLRIMGPRAAATLSSAYGRAALAVVVSDAAMVGAAFMRRLTRVPWMAAPKPGLPVRRRLIGQAHAVALPATSLQRFAFAHPEARVVAADVPERLATVVRDIALAADARQSRGGIAPIVADAWTFANDRAANMAIRLIRLTQRSPERIHPKHLVEGPWNRWYLDEISPTDQILDVGCGNGVHTVAAAQVAAGAVGVDLDGRQLELARARAREAGASNVVFERGDLTEAATLSRLAPGSFDVALLLDVLEHIEDRHATLERVLSLLKPGGKAILTVPVRDTPYKRWRRRMGAFAYSDPDHKIEFSEADVRHAIESAGFSIERCERTGYDSPVGGFVALLGVLSVDLYRWIAARRSRLGREHPEHGAAFSIVARAP